jgi:heme O synthase-like polyprenyltransferase
MPPSASSTIFATEILIGKSVSRHLNTVYRHSQIHTERTKDRPLARGVVPIGGAAILTVLLLCATLGVLSFANSRV